MAWKALYVKEGDLPGTGSARAVQAAIVCRGGVRAPIVAEKRGNARGAKGCRKVDV